jgi:hypothetical protein
MEMCPDVTATASPISDVQEHEKQSRDHRGSPVGNITGRSSSVSHRQQTTHRELLTFGADRQQHKLRENRNGLRHVQLFKTRRDVTGKERLADLRARRCAGSC